ncbi:uncharacterized protein LOC119688827 [Teleopsis dalmanni]|uniref:uncharacterized protein LOC119688827 n=1 Tax=Teleopsis dalmanni TaxID=139649 RepID=UPI0018CF38B6|nr:uncharacterized protein LOC119688827 [Teleopsis dalmanni]
MENIPPEDQQAEGGPEPDIPPEDQQAEGGPEPALTLSTQLKESEERDRTDERIRRNSLLISELRAEVSSLRAQMDSLMQAHSSTNNLPTFPLGNVGEFEKLEAHLLLNAEMRQTLFRRKILILKKQSSTIWRVREVGSESAVKCRNEANIDIPPEDQQAEGGPEPDIPPEDQQAEGGPEPALTLSTQFANNLESSRNIPPEDQQAEGGPEPDIPPEDQQAEGGPEPALTLSTQLKESEERDRTDERIRRNSLLISELRAEVSSLRAQMDSLMQAHSSTNNLPTFPLGNVGEFEKLEAHLLLNEEMRQTLFRRKISILKKQSSTIWRVREVGSESAVKCRNEANIDIPLEDQQAEGGPEPDIPPEDQQAEGGPEPDIPPEDQQAEGGPEPGLTLSTQLKESEERDRTDERIRRNSLLISELRAEVSSLRAQMDSLMQALFYSSPLGNLAKDQQAEGGPEPGLTLSTQLKESD